MRRISDLSLLDQRAYRGGPLLGKSALDRLMPLHLWAGPTGHILRAGPTFAKLHPSGQIRGRRLTELLEFRRPNGVQMMEDLIAISGATVAVVLREDQDAAVFQVPID
ncbi:MAG: hypothetical protein ACE5DK_07590, partial [Paracoccaceae bacterium]